MEEAVTAFPLRLMSFCKYLTLEVIMNVERSQVLEFLFSANKETRIFLQHTLHHN